jgi:hypothetical protein
MLVGEISHLLLPVTEQATGEHYGLTSYYRSSSVRSASRRTFTQGEDFWLLDAIIAKLALNQSQGRFEAILSGFV